jgi:hypothetical protein
MRRSYIVRRSKERKQWTFLLGGYCRPIMTETQRHMTSPINEPVSHRAVPKQRQRKSAVCLRLGSPARVCLVGSPSTTRLLRMYLALFAAQAAAWINPAGALAWWMESSPLLSGTMSLAFYGFRLPSPCTAGRRNAQEGLLLSRLPVLKRQSTV